MREYRFRFIHPDPLQGVLEFKIFDYDYYRARKRAEDLFRDWKIDHGY